MPPLSDPPQGFISQPSFLSTPHRFVFLPPQPNRFGSLVSWIFMIFLMMDIQFFQVTGIASRKCENISTWQSPKGRGETLHGVFFFAQNTQRRTSTPPPSHPSCWHHLFAWVSLLEVASCLYLPLQRTLLNRNAIGDFVHFFSVYICLKSHTRCDRTYVYTYVFTGIVNLVRKWGSTRDFQESVVCVWLWRKLKSLYEITPPPPLGAVCHTWFPSSFCFSSQYVFFSWSKNMGTVRTPTA